MRAQDPRGVGVSRKNRTKEGGLSRRYATKRRLVVESNEGGGFRRRWRWSVEDAYASEWRPFYNGYAMTLDRARAKAYRAARHLDADREEAVVICESPLRFERPKTSIAEARHL
jgi:hypothetical protein